MLASKWNSGSRYRKSISACSGIIDHHLFNIINMICSGSSNIIYIGRSSI